MNRALRRILLMLLVMSIIFVIMFTIQRSIQISFVVHNDGHFLINTEGCKIPKMDPYDPSIKSFLDTGSELKCSEQEDLVYAKQKYIHINWELANRSFPNLVYCKYDVIWRPPNVAKRHNFYVFKNESGKFVSKVLINEDFIRVRCFNEKNTVIYTNVFLFVKPKENVEKRCNERLKLYSKYRIETLSVLMVGVDSVSRSNMVRYMPKTRGYLLQNMSAFEFIGYNKIADNTFVNIVPMTTGKFVKDLPWTADMRYVPFDKYEFIWKKYSNHGYRTLYCEDAPDYQMFDFLKAGFSKYPTDYFNRPFSVAAEQIPKIWNTGHHCIHARPETSIILDYVEQFASNFNSKPYFSFTFISRLTHEFLSSTRKADPLYLNFFTNLNKAGNLNNTIVFFFSDHGMRYGKVRQTAVGKLEERLPFMFVILPQWFLHKYPNIKQNIQLNIRRLTTPFDIYQTLVHFLNFKPSTKNKASDRGMSILNEIPTSRTCSMAGILPHWCTCSRHEVLSTTSTDAKEIAKHFVEKINGHLSQESQCANLSLEEIKYASKLMISDKVLSFHKKLSDVNNRLVKYGRRVKSYIDYELTIRTSPGNGLFEGTLRYNEKTKAVQMMGDISRINNYGIQSHCVDETNMKKFCFCIDPKK